MLVQVRLLGMLLHGRDFFFDESSSVTGLPRRALCQLPAEEQADFQFQTSSQLQRSWENADPNEVQHRAGNRDEPSESL